MDRSCGRDHHVVEPETFARLLLHHLNTPETAHPDADANQVRDSQTKMLSAERVGLTSETARMLAGLWREEFAQSTREPAPVLWELIAIEPGPRPGADPRFDTYIWFRVTAFDMASR